MGIFLNWLFIEKKKNAHELFTKLLAKFELVDRILLCGWMVEQICIASRSETDSRWKSPLHKQTLARKHSYIHKSANVRLDDWSTKFTGNTLNQMFVFVETREEEAGEKKRRAVISFWRKMFLNMSYGLSS